MIKLNKHNSDFDIIKWVLKAVSKKDLSRPALTKVYISKESIVGCDGIRLHIYKQPHEYCPGLYEVVKLTKTEVILTLGERDLSTYPNYKKAIPDYSQYLYADRLSKPYAEHAFVTKNVHSARGYNYDFFKDFVSLDLFYDLRYSPEEESYLVLEGASVLGVLMPFRLG